MDSVSKKEIVLFVTGFGKFGKILENPTTVLAQNICKLLQDNPIPNLNLHKNYVLKVAIQDCDEGLEEIYAQVNKMIEEDKVQEQSATDQGDSGSSISVPATRHYLVLHFGVYQGSGAFNVELQGRNIKDFFIPDERGNTPRKQCIEDGKGIDHCIVNRLNLDGIVEKLLAKNHKVVRSLSAGEYICNYTYYCSLQHKNNKVLDTERVDTLFCHVPSFEEIDEQKQQAFVVDLIRELADAISVGLS